MEQRLQRLEGVTKIFGHKLANDPDMESIMIDGIVVRAHAGASQSHLDEAQEQALGRSKGGFTTQCHGDALCNPLDFILTGAADYSSLYFD